MSVNKSPNGKWLLECYPHGRTGKRIRKQFTTKGEAIAYERYLLEEMNQKPWLGDKKDNRRLSDLIERWFKAHGTTLDDGEKRRVAMHFAAQAMDNPLATEFNAKLFSTYREKRLSGEVYRTALVKKVAPRTLNLELAYFRAMFNELTRLDEWDLPNPVDKVRAYKTDEQEMAFLSHEDIQRLLDECQKSSAKDLINVVKVCLATGARWSEAESLTSSQVMNNMVTFIQTKGNRNRSVPISAELSLAITQHNKKNYRLFSPCYYAFRSALKRTQIELPAGQLSHVLRHTFASHFMMNGGNILVLQRILGHTDIKMTMRYAHFAPDHLNDAVAFNPLAILEK